MKRYFFDKNIICNPKVKMDYEKESEILSHLSTVIDSAVDEKLTRGNIRTSNFRILKATPATKNILYAVGRGKVNRETTWFSCFCK